jgi:hypothetical protein
MTRRLANQNLSRHIAGYQTRGLQRGGRLKFLSSWGWAFKLPIYPGVKMVVYPSLVDWVETSLGIELERCPTSAPNF